MWLRRTRQAGQEWGHEEVRFENLLSADEEMPSRRIWCAGRQAREVLRVGGREGLTPQNAAMGQLRKG